MKTSLQRTALVLALAGVGLLPFVAGKLFAWQGFLVVGWAALVGLLASVAALLPEKPAVEAPSPKRAKGEKQPTAPAEVALSKFGWRPDAVDWALLAFIVLQVISLGVSAYRFVTVLYAAKVVVAGAVFWLARYGGFQRRPERLLGVVVAGGALVALWGLREYVRTVIFLGDVSWRVFSVLYNPNCLAGYLLLTIFPAVALLFGVQTRRETDDAEASVGRGLVPRRPSKGQVAEPSTPAPPRYPEIGAAFGLALMVAVLPLTGSKAALAAFLIGILVLGLLAAPYGRRPRVIQGAALTAVVVLIIAAIALPPIRVRLLSAFGSQNNSMQFRVYTWQGTMDMVKARPLLGHGGGTFEQAFPKYAIAGYTRSAHQTFLQIAAECGIPALLAGLAWGILVLARVGRGALGGKLPRLAGLACAAIGAALVASALQELVDYPWYVPAIGLTFFALAGLGVGLTDCAATRVVPARSGVWPRLGAAGAALLLLWALGGGIGEGLGAKAERLVASGDYALAIATYEQAARWSPWQARFPTQISKLWEAQATGDKSLLARAVVARQKAISLQPTEAVNYVALARLYEQAGDYASAISAGQEALKWYPRYPRGLAQLALIQAEAGKKAEARATYQQLAALWDTPVGQCPAVTQLVETSYCYAWIFQGDEARGAGQDAQARELYGRAARLVADGLALESSLNAQLAAEGGGGRQGENTAIVRQLLERLEPEQDLLSRLRVAQLALATGDGGVARGELERLTAPAEKTAVGQRVQVWALLRLAQELRGEKREEEARGLAAKGLGLARSLPGAPAAGEGWTAADEAELSGLRQAAEQAEKTPPAAS